MSVMVGRERKKSFLLHVVRYECDAMRWYEVEVGLQNSLLSLVMCAIGLLD
jgi:hypothetical protein